MSIYEIGRVCVKIAGRDAGRKCVVVEAVDDKFVTVDGNVRRKKVNIKHLEPLADVLEIKDKASHEDVKKAFEKMGLEVWDKKSKKPAERPRKVRKKKEKLVEEKPKKEKAPSNLINAILVSTKIPKSMSPFIRASIVIFPVWISFLAISRLFFSKKPNLSATIGSILIFLGPPKEYSLEL